VLLFLVCATLILLATAYRPVRFYVVLIPPMCLLASRALTTWTRSSHLRLPSQISRIFPIVLFLGLAYLAYHLLASTVKLVNLARFQTGMKDIRVIADVPTLYGMLAAGLALGMVAVLVILRLILQNPGKRLSLPPRHIRSWIALGFVISVIIANGSQYLLWATEPQFSIVEASGQLEQDLGPGAVLGGPYAVVLAVGNRVPTLSFNPRLSDEELSALGITHLEFDIRGSEKIWVCFKLDIHSGDIYKHAYHVSDTDACTSADIIYASRHAPAQNVPVGSYHIGYIQVVPNRAEVSDTNDVVPAPARIEDSSAE